MNKSRRESYKQYQQARAALAETQRATIETEEFLAKYREIDGVQHSEWFALNQAQRDSLRQRAYELSQRLAETLAALREDERDAAYRRRLL